MPLLQTANRGGFFAHQRAHFEGIHNGKPCRNGRKIRNARQKRTAPNRVTVPNGLRFLCRVDDELDSTLTYRVDYVRRALEHLVNSINWNTRLLEYVRGPAGCNQRVAQIPQTARHLTGQWLIVVLYTDERATVGWQLEA